MGSSPRTGDECGTRLSYLEAVRVVTVDVCAMKVTYICYIPDKGIRLPVIIKWARGGIFPNLPDKHDGVTYHPSGDYPTEDEATKMAMAAWLEAYGDPRSLSVTLGVDLDEQGELFEELANE